MKRLMILFVLIVFAIASVGCEDAKAQSGPDTVQQITALTTRTFVLVQNHLAGTTKKTAYVLARSGDVEVTAWRWQSNTWNQVYPNPAMYADIGSDSTMVCPSGYTLPISGSFDALTIRGILGDELCEVQVYK